MTESSPIQFRSHHFLCALCFQGKGYSPSFIQNFSQIMEDLNAPDGDQVIIEVVDSTDSICAPCPHKRDKECTSQEKILTLDQAHADILGLKAGQKITWQEAKRRIQAFMTLDQFHKACAPCEWKKLNICETALTLFLS